MSVRTKSLKFADDEIVVAWQPFAPPSMAGAIQRGTRLRGDDPIVKAHPQFFVPDGTPEREWPSHWDELVENPVRHEKRSDVAAVIPDQEAAIAMDAFFVDGRYVARGERLRRDDKLVKAHGELFRTPMMPLADGG